MSSRPRRKSMSYKIKFLFTIALILAPAQAGLTVFAQNTASAKLITEFIGDEVSSSSLRGVPTINIGEILVNDPTLIRNPLEVSVVWKVRKASTTTILGYEVVLLVSLKDGRTFQEKKSASATETQVNFAVSIPAVTAARRSAPTDLKVIAVDEQGMTTGAGAQGAASPTSTPRDATASSANRKEDQRSSVSGTQRSGASAASSGGRSGIDANRAPAGDGGRIVPKIAVESVVAHVIPRFTTPLFTSEFSRRKSFKF